MKIDTDCLRAVMLEIEKSQRFVVGSEGEVEKIPLPISSLYAALSQYPKEDIFYSLFNLEQAGYVDLSIQWISGRVYNCSINHMTYSGHEFLNRIRDSKKWTIVKKGLVAVRDYSLSAISAVSEGVANAALTKFLEKDDL